MSDLDIAASTLTAGHARHRAGWSAPALRIVQGLGERLIEGRLEVVAPDGSARWFGRDNDTLAATLIIRRPRAVYRFLKGGALGFAEAYLDGDVDSPDLEALLRLFLVNYETFADRWQVSGPSLYLRRVWHWFNRNTKRGSRRNIRAHYDLGNAFYALWLDPSMTYSAALFEGTDDLQEAQRLKYRRLAERLELAPGKHVLEVGCGWGGFATLAAKEFGCRVTALTISDEQHAFARQRAREAGVADQVDIRFQDYRDLEGRFDAVASIEMFEAVGEAYWAGYFAKLRNVMAPGGKAALQVITIDDRYFEGYRASVDFIQRYVFPGGMLPSPGALAAAGEDQGLRVVDRFAFGQDYARTLQHWAQRFTTAWSSVEALGFDERFRRLWSYYLAYCEAGFRVGTIDVEQVVFRHAR